MENAEKWARALGWFSIGLGLAELLAPREVAKASGLRQPQGLLRLMGLREVVTGVGILMQSHPAPWVQARVAGDMMDLALLGRDLGSEEAQRGKVAAVAAAVAGVTVLDVLCSRQLRGAQKDGASAKKANAVKIVTIDRSPEDLYRFWRDFENLPRFMNNLVSVQGTEENWSHWIAKGPGDSRVEWDAEITDDRPNERIAWRSLPGSDVQNSGSVRFVPATGGRGTIVTVEITYDPPGGPLGATVARLFGADPGQQTMEDLRRFKQLMETGVIPTILGQPAGRPTSMTKYERLAKIAQ